MNDIIIQARELKKVYRLYSKPQYRFLDMFGLLGQKRGAYTEHAALDRVDLDIRRGEKVAIIGRNGAGKSTLLKLITNVTEPTSGQLKVKGKVHALLQIGTGFHPDFTGRENVYAYLAQLGVTGKDADRKCAEIIDFAELEEYIDQPVKTYSTGMGARLMFSTSTAITPNLLVLDEVLGVGDAYFTHKSYERIRELCEGQGTTLLLVTHDLYSALNLCNRFIWLDRGKVRLDDNGKTVVHAYERSIRDQEEERLRQRRLTVLKENIKSSTETEALMYGQIRCCDRQPPQAPIHISHLRFLSDNTELAVLSTVDEAATQGIQIITEPGEGNWSQPLNWHDRPAREFSPHGSIYYRLPFIVNNRQVIEAAEAGNLQVEIGCYNNSSQYLELVLFHPDRIRQFSGKFTVVASPSWLDMRTTIEVYSDQLDQVSLPGEVVRYGQRAMEIVDVQFLNAEGEETFQFDIGSSMRVRLKYRLNDPSFCEFPTLLIAFQKDGVVRSHRFWTDQIQLAAKESKEGVIEVIADPLLLCRGSYAVTVSVFKEGYLTSYGPKRFFSANDQLYDMHSRAYEIVIKESIKYPLCNDAVFQHPSTWLLDGIKVTDSMPLKETFVTSKNQ
ncbi:ABC transporter ATP-binding protein [Allocoleopsis sp.]|uniref:ABC transporter ATP-binding protein n=1 Tax=Allocoleopsis sp. TaxID=3088169 RepID=UPI002FCF55E8